MSQFKIYNSITKTIKVHDFPKDVKIYVCGPTVYNHIHIGNVRPLIVFDFIRRVFLYYKYNVCFVCNITDVNEKINNKFAEEYRLGNSGFTNIDGFIEYYINEYHKLRNMVNVLTPTYEPRVTNYINKIQEYINILIDNNTAYITKSGIYLNTNSIPYGVFKQINELDNICRIEHDEEKNNIKDFALWKFQQKDQSNKSSNYGFDYIHGYGVPGWHIECSVMSQDILGENFHIHGGGIDLQFPHHENEIAQSIARYNHGPCDLWMHNNMINISGIKMSKSYNNFILGKDVIKNTIDGDIFRYFILSNNYMNEINFNPDDWEKYSKGLLEIRAFYFKNIYDQNIRYNDTVEFDFLFDNFNSAKSIQQIHTAIHNNNIKEFYILNHIIGFAHNNYCTLSVEQINKYLEQRTDYKNNKNYIESDNIRKLLYDNYVIIEDLNNNQYSL